jgi:hypothetical protein
MIAAVMGTIAGPIVGKFTKVTNILVYGEYALAL